MFITKGFITWMYTCQDIKPGAEVEKFEEKKLSCLLRFSEELLRN